MTRVGNFGGENKRQTLPWFWKLEVSQFSFPSFFPPSTMSLFHELCLVSSRSHFILILLYFHQTYLINNACTWQQIKIRKLQKDTQYILCVFLHIHIGLVLPLTIITGISLIIYIENCLGVLRAANYFLCGCSIKYSTSPLLIDA